MEGSSSMAHWSAGVRNCVRQHRSASKHNFIPMRRTTPQHHLAWPCIPTLLKSVQSPHNTTATATVSSTPDPNPKHQCSPFHHTICKTHDVQRHMQQRGKYVALLRSLSAAAVQSPPTNDHKGKTAVPSHPTHAGPATSRSTYGRQGPQMPISGARAVSEQSRLSMRITVMRWLCCHGSSLVGWPPSMQWMLHGKYSHKPRRTGPTGPVRLNRPNACHSTLARQLLVPDPAPPPSAYHCPTRPTPLGSYWVSLWTHARRSQCAPLHLCASTPTPAPLCDHWSGLVQPHRPTAYHSPTRPAPPPLSFQPVKREHAPYLPLRPQQIGPGG